MEVVSIIFGAAGLLIFYGKSRVAAALLLASLVVVTIVDFGILITRKYDTGIVVDTVVLIFLSILTWRGFRATLALRRLKLGKPLSVASTFD